MSAWHVDPTVMGAYGARSLDPVQRASVEAHVGRCAECRTALVPAANDLDLDALWSRIETTVTTRAVGRVGRALLRVGVPMPDLVVLGVIAAQSLQWTLATTLVLVVTGLAAMLGPVDAAHVAFLIVAPLLPALGVAATYRLVPHGVDALERTAPYSPARMLLWRTSYVVATAVPVAAAVGAVVLSHPGAAVSWLIPAVACTSCVVAAANRRDPGGSAAFVAVGWTAIVGFWQVRDTPWAITTAPTQLAAAAVAAAALLLLHHRLERGQHPSAVGGV